MTDDDEMTLTPEQFEQQELSFCPFELIPGSNGTTLMFWDEEDHVVATFPSMEVAKAFIIGGDNPLLAWPARRPGWDRSDIGVDVKGALARYRREHGAYPTFEFDASHTVLDLYEPLGLATEFVARLIYYEVGCVSADIDPDSGWGAMISRLLVTDGLDRETAESAAWDVAKLLFEATEAIQKLEEQWKGVAKEDAHLRFLEDNDWRRLN